VDITDASAKNYRHQLPYTPRHSGKFTLSLINPYVNVSYIFTAVGDRYMLPQNTLRNRIDGYTEHSFSLNRDFVFNTCSLRVQGELLNVGNEQYEVIRYYPMPRFSWRLSACFSF
jgi:outer membrane cobalamin receptor